MRLSILHGSNDNYGASRVLVQDVSILRSLGHDVTVSLPSDGPLTDALLELDARVSIDELRPFRKVDGVSGLRIPLVPPLHCARADVVVLWTLALAGYLPSLIVRRKHVVTSVHEILPGRAGRVLGVAAVALSNATMANSAATAAWLAGTSAPRLVRVAYPIAPRYDPLPIAGFRSGAIRLLLAGRMNGHKGHVEAIAAVDLARRSGVDAQLVLVGSPFPGQEGHASRIIEMARSRPWVQALDEVDDIRQLLRDCDVVLVPTTRPEPFGIVAVEAWAAGRRIIASDCGGLAEATNLVGGELVPMGDVVELAKRIELAALDRSLREPPPQDMPVLAACSADARERVWIATLERARLRPPVCRPRELAALLR